MAHPVAAPTTRSDLAGMLNLTSAQVAKFLRGGDVGLTRREAARRIGCSTLTVYRMLRGEGPYAALHRRQRSA